MGYSTAPPYVLWLSLSPYPRAPQIEPDRDPRSQAQHEENVIAVHCKAGKGRTGMLVSCLLVHMGIAQTAEEAQAFFAGTCLNPEADPNRSPNPKTGGGGAA